MIKNNYRSREKLNDSQSVVSVITKGGGSNPFTLKKNSSSKKVLATSIRNSNDFVHGGRTQMERNRSDGRVHKASMSNLKFGAYEDLDTDMNIR